MTSSISEKESAVRQYSKLVMSIAAKFSGRAEINDLYQAGCVGLLKALEKFDESKGYAFTTYAVPVIIGEIKMYLRSNGPSHIPRPVREMSTKCLKAQDELRNELLRDPTVSEIAKRLNTDPSDVAFAMEAYVPSISLCSPPTTNNYDDLPDMSEAISDKKSEAATESIVDSISLKQAMSELSELEKNVITMRFFEEMKQTAVAKKLSISQTQVHRLEKSALKKLKERIV